MDLHHLTISTLHKHYLNGDFSVTEITQAYLSRIKKYNPILNAFITVAEDYALQKAKQLDKKPKTTKPLFGVPIALKDLYLTQGIRTTAGSKVLDNYIPQYPATAWEKLESAGAVLLGKLNCDAWAHGSSGENSQYGPTKNPWDTTRVPGGSSSGSGAALAADLALITTGTDTGGSIRNPATFCNLVGIKPTYGRVSRYGIIAMCSSTDSIGHLGKTVEDVARVLSVTAGPDPHDATTTNQPVPDYSKKLTANNSKLTLGIPKEYFTTSVDPEVSQIIQQSISQYQNLGFKIKSISLPHTKYALAIYYIIQPSEVSSNLGRYDGIRYGQDRSHLGNEAIRRIMLGTYTLSAGYYDAYYKKAAQVRTLIKQDFDNTFKKADLILTPVSPTPPFKLGEKSADPLQLYLADIFAVTANLAGIPALAIPCGFTQKNLPVGFQLLGPHFSEQLLFQAGHAYQQVTNWHLCKPQLA
jgi:aspartyl-tRNA(Asn)/glutamyl-tRNA(Gln) amidotransferase subunit A